MHYSELGRTDEAIAALQKCLELREDRMVWTKMNHALPASRTTRAFQAILRTMNLPLNLSQHPLIALIVVNR